MAHFAELDHNNEVIQVIVISNQNILDETGKENEEVGINFCKSLYGSDRLWKQTSYNNRIRHRYAGIGMVYNNQYDVFLYPQPYSSWTLNTETFEWESPIPEPELTEEQIKSGNYYEWNEEAHQEDNTTGWVLETPPAPE